MERELRTALTDTANEQAIHNFALNLRPLLMQPPVKGFVTMGLFGIVYLMLKKKMNPLVIMLVILLVSIAGAFFGVLGVQ